MRRMRRNRLLTFVLVVLAIVLGTLALDALLPVVKLPSLALPDLLQNYVTVFLGIFIGLSNDDLTTRHEVDVEPNRGAPPQGSYFALRAAQQEPPVGHEDPTGFPVSPPAGLEHAQLKRDGPVGPFTVLEDDPDRHRIHGLWRPQPT